ncbi:hypothetical protein [Paenibacillus donghaensis]|uniref:DUF3784 domain-containing protein n=1 Tax=Paenibacillus donghaensis TaxID=414771 RepID=A0A2Z2KQR5_9BACL|nr:hypothetical protein [Paenibacillus donghaensis]ASA21238.1 hypothetical protein B9T62_10840 [Paenibacillus donghaensis]
MSEMFFILPKIIFILGVCFTLALSTRLTNVKGLGIGIGHLQKEDIDILDPAVKSKLRKAVIWTTIVCVFTTVIIGVIWEWVLPSAARWMSQFLLPALQVTLVIILSRPLFLVARRLKDSIEH